MPFDGNGVFLRVRNWMNDAAANIRIRADRHDSEDDNFALGLTQCITKDGQTTITANLPMATYRHINVGSAQNPTDYARFDQVQGNKSVWAIAGGTADAITATYNPTTPTPTDGFEYAVRATAANTTATPTFSPDGGTPRTIVKYGNEPLVAGDIAGDGHELILRYRESDTKYELLNPYPTLESLEASDVSYDNSSSGLDADNAQEAIDELASGSFLSKPIGEIFLLQDNLAGCPIPSNTGPAKFIRLTAGEDGTGDYNDGLLDDETIDANYEDERGHVGLSITAEILVGPMAGQRIELINSSEAFVGARETAGVLTHDQMQVITGKFDVKRSSDSSTLGLGRNFEGAFYSGGNSTNGGIGTGTTSSAATSFQFNSSGSPDSRTGSGTIPKTYSATAYMRIA